MLVRTDATIMAEMTTAGDRVGVERRCGFVCDPLGRPVPGGAESRQKKAAEEHLLKEGRDGDAEAKHQPCGFRRTHHLFDGGVGGAGHKHLVERSQPGAAQGRCGERPKPFPCHRTAPLDACKEAFIPKKRENDEAEGKGDEIEKRFAGEDEMDIGGRILLVSSQPKRWKRMARKSTATVQANAMPPNKSKRQRWPKCGMRAGGRTWG